jgi:hypothetical protein
MLDVIGVILGAIAILVSVWIAVRQQGVQNRLATIEVARRDEELTARRQADVTAYFEPRVTSHGRVGKSFVVANRGLARARDVTFEIVPVGEGDSPLLVSEEGDVPIPILDSGGTYSWPAEFVYGTASALDVHLRWQDEAGDQSKEIRLSTFG